MGGRPKQYYSIYQKMVNRGRDFTDIHDLTGIRILVSSIRDCYGALGAVHARWNPMPGRFKDYIATPKFNLYQSLHTTVYGPEGRPLEIQIRTTDMHQRAEFGVAAHWKYKERMASSGKDVERASTTPIWRGLRTCQTGRPRPRTPQSSLETLRYEIGAKELYVFTPQGKVIGLPKGAPPVDFAYAVHTEIGHRTMGAKVNQRLVPSGYRTLQWRFRGNLHLQESGRGTESRLAQLCDIPAREKQDPPVVYQGAPRGSDRAGQRRYRQGDAETESTVAETDESGVCCGCRRALLNYPDVEGLYAAVGEGHVSTQSVIEKIVGIVQADDDNDESLFPTATRQRSPRRVSESGVLVRGAPDILVKLARCCTPVPGDPIVGFVTRGTGVSVHREDCSNITTLLQDPERMIEVEWAPTKGSVFSSTSKSKLWTGLGFFRM